MAQFYKTKIDKKQDGNFYVTIVVVNYLGQEIDNTGYKTRFFDTLILADKSQQNLGGAK